MGAPAAASSAFISILVAAPTQRPRAASRPSSTMSGVGKLPRRRLPRFDAPPPAPEADLSPSFALLSLSASSSGSSQRAMSRQPTRSANRVKRPRSKSPQHAASPAAQDDVPKAKRVHRILPAEAAPGSSVPQVPSRSVRAGAPRTATGLMPATTWLDLFQIRDTTTEQWKPLAQRVRRRKPRPAPG